VALACAATACTHNDDEPCHADEVSLVVTETGPVCGTFDSELDDNRMPA
jgi:hypothetical protein